MAKVGDDLARTYAELLDEDPPFLRVHDLLEFCRHCVEQDVAASDIIELHVSLADAHRGSMSEILLAMALAFRTLLQQLEGRRQELLMVEEANDRLSGLYRTKSTMLSMVAHDLSNYLVTSRILALSMVRDASQDKLGERARYMLKVLEEQEHLIDNLLNIGRLEAGVPIHTEQVDLRAVIVRCIEAARKMSGHSFSVRGPNLLVMAHENKVRQILDNLVGNAVKFSPRGGNIEITVGQQGDRALVTVRDEGTGIAAEDLPHIFEPYFRATDNRTPGTGLGLSIVKSLLDLLQGEIHIESGSSGTTARFTLPLVTPVGGLPPALTAGRPEQN